MKRNICLLLNLLFFFLFFVNEMEYLSVFEFSLLIIIFCFLFVGAEKDQDMEDFGGEGVKLHQQ